MKYTPEEVMQFVQEEDVKFIRLAFCNVYGKQHNVAIMPAELKRAFTYGIAFDASAVEGFGGEIRSDLLLHPDPSTLIQLFGGSESGLGHWWSRYMNYYSPLYMIVTALLIIAFTYFYTSISFQPDEMAKNIQQQGGVIPHVRPGKPTADFLARTNNRLTLFAALFLAVLATLPNLFTVGLQTSVPFAASSLLIAVSVVLETKRQLDDLLVSRNYDTLT